MKNNSKLYKWLIVTFIILYSATAFVSFYHSITFFNIANSAWLSVILSLVCEIGQASVLFSLLLTKNKHSTLAWSIMFLLTALQIVGNVVSSYKYITVANTVDFTYFQKSILFWVSDANSNMFKVIIAWITGGILPIIALSMTSLVADNMKMKDEEPFSPGENEVQQEQLNEEIHQNDNISEEKQDEKKDDQLIVKDKKTVSKPKSRKKLPAKKINVKGNQIQPKPIKDLDSIKKISKGTELIQMMQGEAKKEHKETHNPPELLNQIESKPPTDTSENLLSTVYDKNGNVIDKNFK